MSKWMPIETAPADTRVLTWHDCGVEVNNMAHPAYGKRGYSVTQEKNLGLWPSEVFETGRPTHWMPLPEPPEAAK